MKELEEIFDEEYEDFEILYVEENNPNFKYEYAFEQLTERSSVYRTISPKID